MFLFRNSLKVRIFALVLLTLMVVAVFHNHTKRAVDNQSSRVEPISDRFTKLIVERVGASRKVLADHDLRVPATQSTNQRIVLVSTWRSGSTFTGELLSKIPGVLYNFEPFLYMDFNDIPIRNERLTTKYVTEFSKLLECDYGPLLKNYQWQVLKSWSLVRNTVYQNCREVEATTYCEKAEHLSQACRYFPIQITKVVRMPLRYILPALRRPELNLHVILLVRDPRGTMASRFQTGWCKRDCTNPEKLCALLRDNYETALRAAKEFPDHFTVVRYEDIAMDPEAGSKALLKRLGIPVTPSIGEYIRKHAGSRLERSGETFRVRGSRITRWKQTLPWKDVQQTQSVCQDVLAKYGYVPVPDAEALNEIQTFTTNWQLTATV